MNATTGSAALLEESTTIDQVVVGVDGGPHSLIALQWAINEASRRGCRLHVVTCGEVPVVAEAGGLGSAVFTNTYLAAMEQHLLGINAAAVSRARALLPHEVTGETVLGSPAHALSALVAPSDVLVVGATNHPGRLTGLVGSVATTAAHRAKCVTVAVRGEITRSPKFDRVVVGVDGSLDSVHALQWALGEAKLAAAPMTIVHAWSDPDFDNELSLGDSRALRQRHAQSLLDDMIATAAAIDPTVNLTPVLVEGHPVKAIVDVGHAKDLVVVGSRGRGGFRAMLLGSVSRSLLEHAACSVAVVPHH
jgi:nucleotide-binding universal stress UspA family protein